MTQEPRAVRMRKRRKQAIALRRRGYSFAEIGALLTPPISKQAAQRLVERAEAAGE